MNRTTIITLGLVIGLTAASISAAPTEIKLPPDTSTLRASELPGYAVALQKCSICHSADYVSFQPPNMNQAQWTAEMTKMQHSYGAPLSDDEVKLIGAYLAVAYGGAKATDPDVVALSATAEAPGGAAIDVQALLNSNACLACHAIDNKVVGPAFRDVATKYKGDTTAQDKLAAYIQKGGVGNWGQVPMPPMAGLNDAQAQALATFVLKQ